ncbi:response regulator transcription factor [Paractinoplanes hotanensis]|uniref:Response regulator transcription factor n=1 Tax=Paractinoplanes hotanensis TaxID=2906497 RepID=A0ABT0Y5I7_9ACTN|nr:response regulator transcription factor [Actinoplanes hotanensis]MCM4081120.1 response regulator transcription factor [Actinoplanes hotanensis]
MTRVLVVEDDENLRLAVTAELARGGVDVRGAGSLAGADAELTSGAPDCVVFDRMLPDGDAAGYVGRRRRAGWTTPVLFLTARDTVADVVAGFEHGADDYLVKPFAMAELVARVGNLVRRGGAARPAVLRHADLEVNGPRRQARRAGVLLGLTAKEFAVLEHLMSRPGQAVSRTELIDHCWDTSTDPMSNVVDAVVRRLRAKLGEPTVVHTVRGRGYRFASEAES